jgi:hypothetical protein
MLRRPTYLVCLLAFAFPLLAVDFDMKCHPFQSIEVKRPIDSKCGPTGDAGSKKALALQDAGKDNFCAKGTPKEMQFADYPKLQAAAQKALGGPSYKPPTSRAALQKLGEGTLVRIVAYVDRARYSDVEKGESVNCNLSGDIDNDVHVPLLAKPGENECTSVTAEISPHYRPNAWTPGNLNKQTMPVRITGQLLFDAEHKPCTKTKVEEPKRQSVWEIHPVYKVELCTAKSASGCVATDDSVWTPLQ